MRALLPPRALLGVLLPACALLGGCLESVDRGEDFDLAEVRFDADYYYCEVEPLLVARRCGSGDPAQGDPSGGCHASVTSFRFQEYSPLVADGCVGGRLGNATNAVAEGNYQAAQSQMRRDPALARLITRPSGRAAHPRVVLAEGDPALEVLRAWAQRYSTP